MQNSLDPDRALHFVVPDLDPNSKSYQQTILVGKDLNRWATSSVNSLVHDLKVIDQCGDSTDRIFTPVSDITGATFFYL